MTGYLRGVEAAQTDNRNPPYYYATACKESVKKGGLASGSVDTGALISSERNSIIAEFCRRVQAVIWNRCLVKTKAGRLGLVGEQLKPGDKVCIIFGCTVPVMMRCGKPKTAEDIEHEVFIDQLESLKAWMARVENSCFLRLRYKRAIERAQGEQTLDLYEQEIKEEQVAINSQIESWKKQDAEALERKTIEEEDKKKRKSEAEKRLRERNMELRKRQTELGRDGNSASAAEATETARREKAQREAQEEDPKLFYNLHGEAYIHGMMDGEAIREHIMEGIPVRMFEIR
ncbi:hypothetical protein QBC47DRAFT_438077 [Echria macrotheca]|uniref:Uncharacterized protein n=1 Tax=Echria macrotheca TaxID=438768 RepID=A0AAJ0BKC7_9PEZI|nr:hypothetical protein QBC47DRAFT_438077 [Echria macrotheca]